MNPVRSATLLVVATSALAGCSCRVQPAGDGPGAGADLGELDLGDVPVGGTLALRLPLATLVGEGESVGASDVSVEGERFETTVQGGAIDLRWSPADEAVAEATVTLRGLGHLLLHARGVPALDPWPDPVAVHIGVTALSSLPETGLGDAAFDGQGAVAFGYDPVSGNAWFGDPVLGRAWRVDAFYNHSPWGLWVADSKLGSDDWTDLPGCFEDTTGLVQNGTCDGTEVDASGQPPKGWHFFHGGFAGEGELEGITALAPDPVRGRMWAVGPGWLEAIDTDLVQTVDEGPDAYAFTQLLPDAGLDLGADWPLPWAAVDGDDLWLVDRASGRVGTLALPPLAGPTVVATTGAAVSGVTLGDGLLYLARTTGITAIDLNTGEVAWMAPFAVGQVTGDPTAAWADAGRAWFAWGGVLVSAADGEARLWLPPEDGAAFTGVVVDRVFGGTADDVDVVYVTGEVGGVGRLWAASTEGPWIGEGLPLPAVPAALGHGRDAHDLYVLYVEGSDGCEDGGTGVGAADLAALCAEGSRPAVVHSLYNPYGLVPPASRGHLLNLFLSPILESPKDSDVDTNYSYDTCTGSPIEVGCCALAWSVDQRIEPNADYLLGVLGAVGADTESTEDDPTFAWGINPSYLRQARLCLDEETPALGDAGKVGYLAVGDLVGPRSELTAWTHTSSAVGRPDNENHRFFLDLLYEEGVDYTLPIDSQAEYQMLHDGLAAVYDTSEMADADLRALDLWTPMVSGNALDSEELVSTAGGWPDDDPSWVVPARDGPLALGQPARQGFYFTSAGAQVDIGSDSYKKKELWPLDVRQRAALVELPEAVADLGEGGTSGLVNISGLSWELGILSNLSDAGGYRESLIYGQTVDERDWDFQFRYLRRLAATGDALEVKACYQHIFDVAHKNGLFIENSAVDGTGDPETDLNVQALQRINEELVAPGYVRWATPSEILAEWDEANP